MELWQLKQRQSLPLEAKINHSLRVIREWYEQWDGQVYVSFSGGKDSTVLLHLVRSLYPDVPAVFVDTGLEYPEVKEYVKTYIKNNEKPEIRKSKGFIFKIYDKSKLWIIKPKMSFVSVIEKYGYPVVSKEVAESVEQARKNITTGKYTYRLKKLNGTLTDKNGNLSKYNQGNWNFLLKAPYKISGVCCKVMKKDPIYRFEKETGRKPFIGTLAEESMSRMSAYLRQGGCNSFNTKRPTSKPLSIWVNQNVLQYIKFKNLLIALVYGEVIYAEPFGNEGYIEQDMFGGCCDLMTTGVDRTGCMFCMFGVHLEKGINRFQRMKRTHPKLYDFCINKLGCGKVLDYIGVKYA